MTDPRESVTPREAVAAEIREAWLSASYSQSLLLADAVIDIMSRASLSSASPVEEEGLLRELEDFSRRIVVCGEDVEPDDSGLLLRVRAALSRTTTPLSLSEEAALSEQEGKCENESDERVRQAAAKLRTPTHLFDDGLTSDDTDLSQQGEPL